MTDPPEKNTRSLSPAAMFVLALLVAAAGGLGLLLAFYLGLLVRVFELAA